MTNSPRVLIVGAGPTGLTAALELARGGIMPRIIEQRSQASGLSRAVGITPATMDIFAPSCVGDDIRAEAVIISGMHMFRDATPVAKLTIPTQSHCRQMLGLPQNRTEHHIVNGFAALGGVIEYATTLDGLDRQDDQVVATINGTPETFDIVIGADGIQSTVRKAANIPFDGYTLSETWSIADVDAADVTDGNDLKLFLTGRGKVAMQIPLEQTRWRLVSNTDDALATLPVPLNVTKIHRTGQFGIQVKQATTYQKGPIFLAGDAAHCHSSVGGRGMNLGIADVAVLADMILSGDTADYSASRHGISQRTIKMTERARRIVTSPNPVLRRCIITLFKLISHIPPIRKRIIRQIMQ